MYELKFWHKEASFLFMNKYSVFI